jgi:HAD superfamily hydrolase (TIGR01509 family)
MTFKALIFDFDGIITDTEPIHMDAWQGILEQLGITFDEDEYREHYLGRNDSDFLDTVGKIHGHHFSGEDKVRLTEQKGSASLDLLRGEVPLMPGIEDFIASVTGNYPMAICSGAMRSEIEYILHRLGWSKLFNPIVAGEAVKKGKPDPEGYIRAFEGVQELASDMILPENTLAIEDSPKGVTAAKLAGLKCLAVQNSFSADILSEADFIIPTLVDFDISKI